MSLKLAALAVIAVTTTLQPSRPLPRKSPTFLIVRSETLKAPVLIRRSAPDGTFTPDDRLAKLYGSFQPGIDYATQTLPAGTVKYVVSEFWGTTWGNPTGPDGKLRADLQSSTGDGHYNLYIAPSHVWMARTAAGQRGVELHIVGDAGRAILKEAGIPTP